MDSFTPAHPDRVDALEAFGEQPPGPDALDARADFERRRAMVDALHSSPRPLVFGAVMSVVTAMCCAWQTGDPRYAWFGALIGFLGAARIAFRLAYLRSPDRGASDDAAVLRARKHRLTRWRHATVALGGAATLCFGLLAAYAIGWANDPFASIVTAVVAFGNAIGIAGRSFGSALLARVQTVTLYLPIAAAFLLQGSWLFAILGGFVILFVPLLIEVSDGQRAVLSGAVRARAESETLSRQLSVALETTPNGVLMFDAAGNLQLWNDQAAALLDLPSNRDGLNVAAIEARVRRVMEPLGGPWSEHGMLEVPQEAKARAAHDLRLFDIRSRRNATGELLVRIDDVTEARLAERRITHLGRFDGLTGLANRAWFFSRGEAMLPPPASAEAGAHLAEVAPGVCVATLDIDGLRAINETHGHAVTDAVLSEIGERLSRIGGAERLCARLGGDDFAVLSILEGNHAGDVTPLREDLEAAVTFTFDARGTPIAVTGRVGLCVDTGSGLTLDELIERADFAQRLAKENAHAVSAVFEPGMEESFGRAKRLREDVARAIRDGEIRTVYQPIWSVASNGPVAFEALARWTHGTFGPVPPDEFVRMAEDAGLVSDLTRLQLNAATRFCASLAGGASVSVNLSAHDFSRGDVAADIADALARSSLPAQRLVVEVTETSLLELGPRTFATFEAIRATGVRVALDDFGTGYSSLSYLQRLQLDIVKVDRAFLASLHEGTRTASVLAAVRRLAEGLDMTVVVEGVETPEQLDTLTTELGFDLIQGYLYGAPVPAKAARTLLERSRPDASRNERFPVVARS